METLSERQRGVVGTGSGESGSARSISTKKISPCVLNIEPATEDKGAGPVYSGGCQLTASFAELESETQRRGVTCFTSRSYVIAVRTGTQVSRLGDRGSS